MPAAQINPSSSVLTAAVSIERERPDFPSDKKRRDALVLFNCGLGYSKVADILELNPNTVRDWAKSFLAGKFKTELSKTQFRYSEDSKLRCVTMRLSGMSWSAIERDMGVAQATVRRWVRAAESKKQAKEILSDGR